MAIQAMGYTKSSVSGKPEILRTADYDALPVTLDSTAFTNGVCLAGTPIAGDGTKYTGATGQVAMGILLWDVPIERPQATVVVFGCINTAVAQEHSGVTYTADTKSAFKLLGFM